MSKYFTTTVKPTVTASLQHTAAFTSGDVLFDWTEFEIPRGASRLIGATVLVRPKGDAGPTANNFGMNLVFSTTNTTSLGTINSAPDNAPSNDFIGHIEFQTTTSYTPGLASTTIGTAGRASNTNTDMAAMVLETTTDGTNVGYDKLYVGGIAAGAFDFISLNANTEDLAAEHADSKVITMDGSGMDVREHFIAGDVIHIGTSVGTPAADSLIGTVASADSATQITLDAVSATSLVDGDIFYNIHPIRIILSFEK
tara:strand:- start:263 stop:1027 length:765 start_codon:yes stop_codon:yes gene_type:complete